MNTDGDATQTESTQQQAKQVPESDMFAQKRRAEKAEGSVGKLEKQVADLLAKADEAQLAISDDVPETTKALQQSLMTERKKLRDEREAFDKERETLTVSKLDVRKAEIAKEFGVEESVVESAESEVEAENLALKSKIQSGVQDKPKEDVQKRADYDTGTGGATKTENDSLRARFPTMYP